MSVITEEEYKCVNSKKTLLTHYIKINDKTSFVVKENNSDSIFVESKSSINDFFEKCLNLKRDFDCQVSHNKDKYYHLFLPTLIDEYYLDSMSCSSITLINIKFFNFTNYPKEKFIDNYFNMIELINGKDFFKNISLFLVENNNQDSICNFVRA
jgi:hypothetical protein